MIVYHTANIVYIRCSIWYNVLQIFLEVATGVTLSLETKCRTRLENASASSSEKLGVTWWFGLSYIGCSINHDNIPHC
jgi:hypothetical protein